MPSVRVRDALISERYFKDEPIDIGDWKTPEDAKWRLIEAYNWYNYMHTVEDGKKWLLLYLKTKKYDPNLIERISAAPTIQISPTTCWIARILLNENRVPKATVEFFERTVRESAIHGASKKVETKNAPMTGVQKHMQRAALDHVGEIEDLIDNVIRDKKQKVDVFGYLTTAQVPKKIADIIKTHYEKFMSEINSPDPQIKEAYGKEFVFWQKFYTALINDIDKYINSNITVKKPRKARRKKERLPAQIIKAVQYQETDKALQLTSIKPVKILGASMLWVYNTKYKIVTLYVADNHKGFGVKGTTLQGFDKKLSIQKTARKPKIITKQILEGGKPALKKIMGNLNTKGKTPTGRLNKQTILLRAI